MLKILENSGFLVNEGLHYCAGVESIYREVLQSAAQEGEEKISVLDKCMKEQDFHRYQIEVHGIKNVAQTIGAVQLFEAASVRNDALKAGRYEEVVKGHESFQKIYQEEIAVIREAIEE